MLKKYLKNAENLISPDASVISRTAGFFQKLSCSLGELKAIYHEHSKGLSIFIFQQELTTISEGFFSKPTPIFI